MANINDYLIWRGDIPISKKYPFNELDSMVLARFSYLPFHRIKMKRKETIYSIYNRMKYFPDKEFMYNGDKDLIINLGQSERFKNLIVTDYLMDNSKKNETQFSAITIHLSKHELYISIFGTDYTIFAWKEDFNMGFMDNVPCQLAGKKYLEAISKKNKTKKIRIGGHSKGGNVSIYSAITTNKRIQNKIIKVYNYDGPGFNDKIISKYGDSNIISKIESYIPEESVIGRILNHKEKTSIIASTEKGLYQHDIFSWQVLKDKPIKVKKNSQSSEKIDETLTKWLETTTPEQRKLFVDTIFDVIYSTGSNTLSDLTSNLTSNITKMLKKYSSIDKEDKKELTNMVKLLASLYWKSYRDNKKKEKNKLKAA